MIHSLHTAPSMSCPYYYSPPPSTLMSGEVEAVRYLELESVKACRMPGFRHFFSVKVVGGERVMTHRNTIFVEGGVGKYVRAYELNV